MHWSCYLWLWLVVTPAISKIALSGFSSHLPGRLTYKYSKVFFLLWRSTLRVLQMKIPGYQWLFMRGFRFQSSPFSSLRPGRPEPSQPSVLNRLTREKDTGTQAGLMYICNQNNKTLYKHSDQSLLSLLALLSNSYMQRAMNKVLLSSVIWVRFLIWGTKYTCHINYDGLFLPPNFVFHQDWLKSGQRYVLCTTGSSPNFNWRYFWKRELTTSSAEYSITNKQNNGPKWIKSFQILFTKIGNDVIHLTRNTSLPHGRQESLNHSLMFELLCN